MRLTSFSMESRKPPISRRRFTAAACSFPNRADQSPSCLDASRYCWRSRRITGLFSVSATVASARPVGPAEPARLSTLWMRLSRASACAVSARARASAVESSSSSRSLVNRPLASAMMLLRDLNSSTACRASVDCRRRSAMRPCIHSLPRCATSTFAAS